MVIMSMIKSCFRLQGIRGLEERLSLGNKVNVEDEYKEAIRTRSYNEISSKVEDLENRSPSSSSSSLHSKYAHLTQYLLKPHQENLAYFIKSSNLDSLLINYFDASLEATNVSELLLKYVRQTRLNYQILIGLQCQASNNSKAIINDISSFSSLENQLSTVSPRQFGAMHDRYNLLLNKLTLKSKKIRKRAIIINRCKKVLVCALIVSYGALGAALIVFALHSLVGVAAAPLFIATCFGLLQKIAKLRENRFSLKLARIGQQLDIAARGVYILINDFDTMSRLVRRLNDEVEHIKDIADICVRTGRGDEVLKEVVREIGIHENCFLEQLKELEEHIYLCFLTIDRTRRLVLQEMIV